MKKLKIFSIISGIVLGTVLSVAGISQASSVFAPYQEGTGTSSAGYVLQSQGTSSFAKWVATSTLGISANPASPASSIQFNNAGVFGGSANATLDGTGNITANSFIKSGGLCGRRRRRRAAEEGMKGSGIGEGGGGGEGGGRGGEGRKGGVGGATSTARSRRASPARPSQGGRRGPPPRGFSHGAARLATAGTERDRVSPPPPNSAVARKAAPRTDFPWRAARDARERACAAHASRGRARAREAGGEKPGGRETGCWKAWGQREAENWERGGRRGGTDE